MVFELFDSTPKERDPESNQSVPPQSWKSWLKYPWLQIAELGAGGFGFFVSVAALSYLATSSLNSNESTTAPLNQLRGTAPDTSTAITDVVPQSTDLSTVTQSIGGGNGLRNPHTDTSSLSDAAQFCADVKASNVFASTKSDEPLPPPTDTVLKTDVDERSAHSDSAQETNTATNSFWPIGPRFYMTTKPGINTGFAMDTILGNGTDRIMPCFLNNDSSPNKQYFCQGYFYTPSTSSIPVPTSNATLVNIDTTINHDTPPSVTALPTYDRFIMGFVEGGSIGYGRQLNPDASSFKTYFPMNAGTYAGLPKFMPLFSLGKDHLHAIYTYTYIHSQVASQDYSVTDNAQINSRTTISNCDTGNWLWEKAQELFPQQNAVGYVYQIQDCCVSRKPGISVVFRDIDTNQIIGQETCAPDDSSRGYYTYPDIHNMNEKGLVTFSGPDAAYQNRILLQEYNPVTGAKLGANIDIFDDVTSELDYATSQIIPGNNGLAVAGYSSSDVAYYLRRLTTQGGIITPVGASTKLQQAPYPYDRMGVWGPTSHSMFFCNVEGEQAATETKLGCENLAYETFAPVVDESRAMAEIGTCYPIKPTCSEADTTCLQLHDFDSTGSQLTVEQVAPTENMYTKVGAVKQTTFTYDKTSEQSVSSCHSGAAMDQPISVSYKVTDQNGLTTTQTLPIQKVILKPDVAIPVGSFALTQGETKQFPLEAYYFDANGLPLYKVTCEGLNPGDPCPAYAKIIDDKTLELSVDKSTTPGDHSFQMTFYNSANVSTTKTTAATVVAPSDSSKNNAVNSDVMTDVKIAVSIVGSLITVIVFCCGCAQCILINVGSAMFTAGTGAAKKKRAESQSRKFAQFAKYLWEALGHNPKYRNFKKEAGEIFVKWANDNVGKKIQDRLSIDIEDQKPEDLRELANDFAEAFYEVMDPSSTYCGFWGVGKRSSFNVNNIKGTTLDKVMDRFVEIHKTNKQTLKQSSYTVELKVLGEGGEYVHLAEKAFYPASPIDARKSSSSNTQSDKTISQEGQLPSQASTEELSQETTMQTPLLTTQRKSI